MSVLPSEIEDILQNSDASIIDNNEHHIYIESTSPLIYQKGFGTVMNYTQELHSYQYILDFYGSALIYEIACKIF